MQDLGLAQLPNLYTLDTVPAVGHIEYTGRIPPTCVLCGRPVETDLHNSEFGLDTVRECDLVCSSDESVYLASTNLLSELDALGAKGYEHKEIRPHIGDELREEAEMSLFKHLLISGRHDGPWLYHSREEACPECGQPQKPMHGYSAWMSEVFGDVPTQPRQVYSDTWR
jgi:hypothetical protein